jgi:hypothetical protein
LDSLLTTLNAGGMSKTAITDAARVPPKPADYADYKGRLFCISPFDLFIEGEPVITKLGKKKSRAMRE